MKRVTLPCLHKAGVKTLVFQRTETKTRSTLGRGIETKKKDQIVRERHGYTFHSLWLSIKILTNSEVKHIFFCIVGGSPAHYYDNSRLTTYSLRPW